MNKIITYGHNSLRIYVVAFMLKYLIVISKVAIAHIIRGFSKGVSTCLLPSFQ